jgi:hypothetical protein
MIMMSSTKSQDVKKNVNYALAHKICTNGTLYYPTTKYYVGYNVSCDICNKTNLKICIGYDEKDICMTCVDKYIERSDAKINVHNIINQYIKETNSNEPDSRRLYEYIYNIVTSDKFKSNKSEYLRNWEIRRGPTEQYIFPDDCAYGIINKMLSDLVI